MQGVGSLLPFGFQLPLQCYNAKGNTESACKPTYADPTPGPLLCTDVTGIQTEAFGLCRTLAAGTTHLLAVSKQLCCTGKSSFWTGLSTVNAQWLLGSETKLFGNLPGLGLSILSKFKGPQVNAFFRDGMWQLQKPLSLPFVEMDPSHRRNFRCHSLWWCHLALDSELLLMSFCFLQCNLNRTFLVMALLQELGDGKEDGSFPSSADVLPGNAPAPIMPIPEDAGYAALTLTWTSCVACTLFLTCMRCPLLKQLLYFFFDGKPSFPCSSNADLPHMFFELFYLLLDACQGSFNGKTIEATHSPCVQCLQQQRSHATL